MIIGYRYMLREIAKFLDEDNITFGELSRRLNLSPQELKKYLGAMEERGDLQASCLDSPSSFVNKCAGCAMREICPGTNLGIGKIYRLTEKGNKSLS